MSIREFPDIVHIGYFVSDLYKEIDAFAKLYGVECFTVYDFNPINAWAGDIKLENCRLKIAMGKTKQGLGIELVEPIDKDTPHYEFIKNTGGGIHHICYQVKDFDDWKRYLLSLPDCYSIFEAEVYDDVRGYRRCIFIRKKGAATVIECAEIPRKDCFSRI